MEQINHILSVFPEVFADVPGVAKWVVHCIPTEPRLAVCPPPSHTAPLSLQDTIEQEVQTMLQLGVIELSESPWRRPPVLVPKPDELVQFCIDFRCLNAVPTFDAYPIPHLDTLIHRVGTARYLSMLDLTKGYWQVPLDEEAKEKTEFTTPSVLYYLTKRPFGLHKVAASF